MMNLKTLIITYLFIPFSSVSALPDGSPVCTVGGAAPQSLHLTRPSVSTGPIPTLDFQVKIGNLVLDSTIVNQITPGVDLSVQLQANAVFRGVLIVINNDSVNLSSNLRPNSSSVKAQAQCADLGYSGFTHTDEGPKNSVDGTLFLGPSITAFLDVNIVIRNSQQYGSIYYYTRFQVSTVAQSPPTVPVPVPVPVPIQVPVNPPMPVPVPVPVPIQVPVNPPVPVPLSVPVPVPLPVAAPVPVPLPFAAPIPVPLPGALPVPLPVTASVPVVAPIPVLNVPVTVPIPLPMTVPVPIPMPAPLKGSAPFLVPFNPPAVPTSTKEPTNIRLRRICGPFGFTCALVNECGFFRRLFGLRGC